MENLKIFIARFESIEEPLYLIAKSIDVALSDAHYFDKNNRLLAVIEVSSRVYIDFARENEAIKNDVDY